MRAVVISFLIFVASMALLLPSFNLNVDLVPTEFVKYIPLFLIGLAVLCQWNALLDYKVLLAFKKAAYEYTDQQSKISKELSDKETLLATKTKDAEELQKKLQTLSQSKDSMIGEMKALERSVREAHEMLSLTEGKLQASFEENSKLKNQSLGSDVITFLSLLQERGRFLDFFMDDITSYTDMQVGAASRVVHQGCSKVLTEFFNISPLHDEEEGKRITVQKEEPLQAYRVLGKSFDETPFEAKILHRGWGTDKLNIPRRSTAPTEFGGKLVISPVELELSH